MNRYAHEDVETDTVKKQKRHYSEKQLSDKRKYQERRMEREIKTRSLEQTDYPEPEDNGFYRP